MDPPANDIAAEKIILRWDTTASEDAGVGMIFEGDRQEAKRYLQAVDQILRSMNSTTLSDDQSKRFNNAIQIAMARLEDEFRNILIANSTPIDAEPNNESISLTPRTTPRTSSCRSESPEKNDSSNGRKDESISRISSASFTDRNERSVTFASCRSMNSIREQDLLPPESISDLRSIAERMITAGYYRECVQVYGSVRKSVVDGSFKRLGVEKLSIGDIQRLEWDALNAKIGRWIRAAKVCIRVLFASEKKLCKQIFEDLGTSAVDDACFMETVKAPANQLFNFAEAISISRRSPEKLFKILDLHDSLLDLLPDIDDVFDSKPSESIRIQAPEILSRLAEAARGMISEFENAVLRETSRVPVPGGGPKLRKWYGAPDPYAEDGSNLEEADKSSEEDEVRDAILVTDGDNEIGQTIILSLILKRIRVKALVKDKRAAMESFGTYVESITGDPKDSSFLKKSLRGVRAIICPNEGFLSKVESLKGVQHVVILSQLSVYRASSGVQAIMSSNARNLAEQDESIVVTSGIPYTIVRTGVLTNDRGGKPGFSFEKGCTTNGSLSKEDAAFICIEALDVVPEKELVFEVVNGEVNVLNWKDQFENLMEQA